MAASTYMAAWPDAKATKIPTTANREAMIKAMSMTGSMNVVVALAAAPAVFTIADMPPVIQLTKTPAIDPALPITKLIIHHPT